MQVPPVTSTERTYAASSEADATTTTTKKTTLDQEDFLKLLAAQYQQQDPMNPVQDTEFIAQMAQFTSLEQTKQMVKQMAALSASQDVAAANSYIGRQVTLDAGNDTTVTGVVSGVKVSEGKPQLIVNGSAYDLTTVTQVEPAPATSSNTNTNS